MIIAIIAIIYLIIGLIISKSILTHISKHNPQTRNIRIAAFILYAVLWPIVVTIALLKKRFA